MVTLIVSIWLSCQPLVYNIPADVFLQQIEIREGDWREIQKVIEATKDKPVPINCTIKYAVRPKR